METRDPNRIKEAIHNIFCKTDASVFDGYSSFHARLRANSMAEVMIHYESEARPRGAWRHLFVEHGGQYLHLACEVVDSRPDYETARSIRLVPRRSLRLYPRLPLAQQPLFQIHNCVPEHLIPGTLSIYDPKREQVTEYYLRLIREQLQINPDQVRLSWRTSPDASPTWNDLASGDLLDIDGSIAAPLLLYGEYPVGMVTVHGESLTPEQTTRFSQLVNMFRDDLNRYGCFPQSDSYLSVIDLGVHGVAFLHPVRSASDYLVPGIRILFDLVRGADRIPLRGSVRHVHEYGGQSRIGVQLGPLNEKGSVDLKQFLSRLDISKTVVEST